MAAAGFLPSAVPDLGPFVDAGRWRELGITHWHLGSEEIETHDRQRYTPERWRALVDARYTEHTDDPRRALVWITTTRLEIVHRASAPEAVARRAGWSTLERWVQRAEVTWFVLTRTASPAGGGIAISDGRSVDVFAEPMTAHTCSRHG